MLTQFLVFAILVEAAAQLISDILDDDFTVGQISALIFGQALAWGVQLDLLSAVGIEGEPWLAYVGVFLTGLLVSRGSNYVHDLWSRLGKVRT